MPRANHLVTIHHALPQGSAAMQANIVHGRAAFIGMHDANPLAIQLKFSGLALWRQLRGGGHFHEFRHPSGSSPIASAAVFSHRTTPLRTGLVPQSMKAAD